MSEFQGTSGPDILVGTGEADSFWLQAGGDDNASGGEGSDGFYFGTAYTSSDVVEGGAGIDSLALQGDYLSLALGAINDVEVIALLPGNDTRFGDMAGDSYSYDIASSDARLAAGAILTIIAAELRSDESLTFNGSAESDGNFRIFAGRGIDNLTGGGGSDGFFFGADGNLTGADRVNGGAGIDSIALRGNYNIGRAVAFEAQSLTGVEVVVLLSGHSNEYGGPIDTNGFDYDLTLADGNVAAGQRIDVIAGTLRSNESVRFDGRGETDGTFRLIAGAGDDQLFGGSGNDSLYGGLGADELNGGAGSDLFGFTTALGSGNVDAILDFDTRFDKIELSGAIFSGLAAGAIMGNWMAYGPQATEASHRLIYDYANKSLLYDADGVGGAEAVKFATIDFAVAPDNWNSPGFTLNHFVVTGPANKDPVITSPEIAYFDENLDLSAIVFQITAVDQEGDDLAYYLFPIDGGVVLDKATGAIRLSASADYEERTEYLFRYAVSDSSGRAHYKDVILKVNDLAEKLGATPILVEVEAQSKHEIDRKTFGFADNPDLTDDGIRSIRIEGTIAGSADRDFFEIILKKGELLILDVDNSGGNLDSMLKIVTSSDGIIYTNDDFGIADAGSDPHPEYGHNTDSYIRFRAPEAGWYTFSIESFQDPDKPTFGSYQLNVSLGPAATSAEIWEEDIAAMTSPYKWPIGTLTYAFPTDPAHYPAGIEETDQPGEFAALTAAQQEAVTAHLARIANVSGLSFQLASDPSTANLRFAMTDAAEVAYAYYPGADALGGTAWFNKDYFNDPVLGGYASMAFLHETGHTLGLKHPHDGTAVNFDHDSLEFSVMSYRSYTGAPIGPDEGYSDIEWAFPQSLMILDIAALQRLYGANFATNSGDTFYSWSQATGETFVNGVGQGAPGNGDPRADHAFLTIWDGGGSDTYDLSNFTSEFEGPITIDLRPGEWVQLGQNSSGSQGVLIGPGEFARGNIANALMYEGDPRSLIENAIGSQGRDILIGNEVVNRLTGGGQGDLFRWMSADDTLPGQADMITDFTHVWDQIDLRWIDANTISETWRDKFTFVDTAAFSGKAGELRWDKVGADAHVFGDLDGDAVADLQIIVQNVDQLTSTDFWF